MMQGRAKEKKEEKKPMNQMNQMNQINQINQMNQMNQVPQWQWVGIDVSKAELEIAVYPSQEHWTCSYTPDTPEGIEALIQRLKALQTQLKLVVMEATGGLQIHVVSALAEADIPLVVVNPRQVRDYAKAMGILAKTDKIDAEVIARFAEAVKPKPRALADAKAQELKALMARRRQLVGMLTQEKNRLTRAIPQLQPQIEKHIRWLGNQLKNLDQELTKLVSSSPLWREKEELLLGVPGVGTVFSKSLLAELPELGQLNRKQIAHLAGVAPLNQDSGKRQGKRIVWGGRAQVRSMLYMATLTAIRCNPAIKEFYQRLRKAGKPPKVALTASMRKLLVILNAMLKHKTPWCPNGPNVNFSSCA